MDSQSATPAADAASTVIDIITARLEEAAPDRQLPGLAEFLARVPFPTSHVSRTAPKGPPLPGEVPDGA